MTERLTERMTLEEVEFAIRDHYQYFHYEHDRYPVETGQLGQLWAMFDELVQEEA